MEALRGELTMLHLATKRGVHQAMPGDWRRQAVGGLVPVFLGRAEARKGIRDEELEKLHARIGRQVLASAFTSDVPFEQPGREPP